MPSTKTQTRTSQSRGTAAPRPRGKASPAQQAAEARQQRLTLLGQMIRTSRGTITQTELGQLLGEVRGEEVPQTSVSRWEKGMVELSVEQVRDIELALGMEAGSLLIAAGYVAPTNDDVRAMIRRDETIHPDFRVDAERMYTSYQEMSRRLNDSGRKRTSK